MRIAWTNHDRKTWDAGHARACGALQQDWSYGEALGAIGAKVIRARVFDGATPIAMAQFTSRRIGVLVSVALCSRGPVWLADANGVEPDGAAKAEVYRALKRTFPASRPRVMLFTPDEATPEELEGDESGDIGVKRLTRVMTGYTTVMLDLTQDDDTLRAAQHGKWRNRLAAAEKSTLKVERNGVKPAQYGWLLETEELQRELRGYLAPPVAIAPEFLAAKGDKNAMLILRADEDRDPVAATLFLVHGTSATYHIGWSSEAGRSAGAHNLLLWRSLSLLRERGVRTVELGGVDTGRSAGLARFKIGTGGQIGRAHV